MEEILKAILKTETAAEEVAQKGTAEAKKKMDKAEIEAAAIQKEYALKINNKVQEISDAAKRDGDVLRNAIMKKAQDDAAAMEKKAAPNFAKAAKGCLDYLLGD